MKLPRVLILGKLPPPYMGPAIATSIILNSRLREDFELVHVETKINEDLANLGRWSLSKVFRSLSIYRNMFVACWKHWPDLALVPISQTTTGFVKDAAFILIASAFTTKVVVQLRGSNFLRWLESASGLTRFYVRTILRLTDGVIVLGSRLRSLFEPFVPGERIFVVPNGADYDLPEPSNHLTQDVQVLYLANLQPSKGIQDVVEAVGILAERKVGGFRLDVVGEWRDGHTRDECLRVVTARGLPVRFLGPAFGADKLQHLVDADVFVFTPREPEGHPWVIVEAMAAGLPIVSTDQGAITESVHHGENGFIVPANTPASIADCLERLIGDASLRAAMARASRDRYESGFTERRMVERLSRTFATVLDRDARKLPLAERTPA